ncbi:MAG: GDP-mannose 4,6-dehydratase [Myxococcota bacterium]|nr:GDP-mannose 4,6-dehydratase [Myxococcota bacterium]MDP7074973.1 GDP-mannose 4,6-dehydratase [Myxococcota bacterium]MDP7299017.1 GDP-mannose 4,6-dehydratase [Myxococcota bacterium]MDP7433222.1 GDP-mannose 4,6-dehydratase [Myxococcota bacterium]HJO22569.1 GDP-mannose 4,6-dehydratase [Myxococcota bacterium]
MTSDVALITDITGQDGSCLAELRLGNTATQRDWGYAKEYIEAIWRMLQRDEPADFVVGSGLHHSVRQCVEFAFEHVGLDTDDFLRTDPAFMLPAEVDTLLADPTKAREELGWQARTTFRELMQIMVEAGLEAQERAAGRRRSESR